MPREYDKYNKGDIHWQWYAEGRSYYALVNATVAPFKGAELGTLVDIGCGDGVPTYMLAELGFKVAGVDPSELGVKLAVAHGVSAEFFVEKAEAFEKRGFEFDYLYSLNTIEHMDDPYAMVRLAARARKFSVIATDNDDVTDPAKRSEYHARQYNPREFERGFSRFNVERLQLPEECSSFMAYKIWTKR